MLWYAVLIALSLTARLGIDKTDVARMRAPGVTPAAEYTDARFYPTMNLDYVIRTPQEKLMCWPLRMVYVP